MNEIKEMKEIDVSGKSDFDIIALLLDLTLYSRPDLVNMAFSVLNQNFSQYKTMLDMLKEVQIIADNKTIEDFKSLQEMKYDLSTCAEKTENWMGIDKIDANSDAEKTIKIVDKLCSLLTSSSEDEQRKRKFFVIIFK
jgi:hypothetical protein